jgi:hypothetical protein
VDNYAKSNRWEKIGEIPEDPPAGTPRSVVWEVSSGTHAHYSVDDATGIAYVYVTSDTPEHADDLGERLTKALNALEYSSLVEKFDRSVDEDERAGNLLILALAAPQGFDQPSFDRISKALAAPEASLREAAIYASGYNPSSRYLPLLTRIAQQDPVEDLRADAEDMLAAYDEAGVDKS